MKMRIYKSIGFVWIASFGMGGLPLPELAATPRNLPLPLMDRADDKLDKPQVARDLVGLDHREGEISKGLRGSFVVKHYVSGPWKGGTAIIEVASDLAYAEIRIFDRDG